LDPPYDIQLVFVQKITFVLRKISTKTAATGAALFHSNMHQSFVGWAFAPDPTGGVYNAPPDPPGGLLLKEGEEF